MGDWPRWIDDPNVDSSAMYSAFLSYECRMQSHEEIRAGAYRPVWSGHLKMIIHKLGTDDCLGAFRVSDGGHVKETPCRQMGCRRCEEGRGGYQFKWYSRYWAKEYNKMKRPGAWQAPQSREEPTASSGMRFWVRSSSAEAAP